MFLIVPNLTKNYFPASTNENIGVWKNFVIGKIWENSAGIFL